MKLDEADLALIEIRPHHTLTELKLLEHIDWQSAHIADLEFEVSQLQDQVAGLENEVEHYLEERGE